MKGLFKHKNHLFIFLAVTALFLSILACGSEATPTKVGEITEEAVSEETVAETEAEQAETEVEEATEASSSEALDIYEVGDVISIGDMSMVVLGWASPPGDDFNQPEEGQQFIAVDVLFVNQGEDSDSVSSLLQMTLKDDTGQKYDIDLLASAASGDSSPEGELSPGERLRGKVGYQVPVDAEGLVFVFDADVFSTGKVFIELGPEPISIDPPAELVGETDQDLYAVGDLIEIGDFSLTVNDAKVVEGDDFSQPDEGKQFVVIDLTITNNTDETTAISSLLQMWMKDETGQKYDIDLIASVASGGTTPDGELAPGEKIRGQVGYQVPVDATGLVFVFDADVFGQGKLFVAIPLD